MDAITSTSQIQPQRPKSALGPMTPEVASPELHLISHIDATEPVIEPFATLDIQQLEEMKKFGGANVTADVAIERKTEAPGWKIAKGALTTAVLLAPMAAGIYVAATAGSFLLGAAAVYLGWKGTKKLAMKGFLQKGLGRIMSGIKQRKMEEPRWDARRTYKIEADKSGAIDSKMTSTADLPKVRNVADITDFLATHMKAYPSGTTVVHMIGHGLGYRYSAGLPFQAYEKVLADATNQAGKRADVLLLESCLQGNFEALAATQDYARYTVVSEETISAGVVGDMLRDTVKDNAGKSLTPRQFGEAFVQHGETNNPLKPGAETLVLVDNTKLPALTGAVDKLGTVLAAEVGDGREEPIKGAILGTEQYPKHPLFKDMRNVLAMGDLQDFAERLKTIYDGGLVEMPSKSYGIISVRQEARFGVAQVSPRAREIQAAADEVLKALGDAVVERHVSPRYQKAGGISIQLPGKFEKMEDKPHYKQAGLGTFDNSASPAGWKKFVEAMNPHMQ